MKAVSTIRLALAGFALCFLFALPVAALRLMPQAATTREEATAAERLKKTETMRGESLRRLTTYAVADKEKGLYRIPIERAMHLTVEDARNDAPHPATPPTGP